MKKQNLPALLALAVCIALLGWSAVEVNAVGGDLQYLIPAPAIETGTGGQGDAQKDAQTDTQADSQADPAGAQSAAAQPNAKALALLNSLQTAAEDWTGIIERYALSGIAESATLVGDTDVSKQARLCALGPDALTLSPEYLRFGRLFYPEELENGSDGILLDEQLALALFRVAEPIGRTVTVSGVDFTVIGVLRHTKRVGDSADYAAYVPLAALWNQAVQLDALQVTARPISGAGARSAFTTSMQSWQAGGTLIDLRKESMGALLPLRVLLFFCGCVVLFDLLRLWKNRLRGFINDYRERLKLEYAARLMPRLLAGTLLLALSCCLLALGAAVLINYIVAPVYTFPEWVPTVLVEWDDITAAFWRVWQGAAGLTELRSPELIRLRYFAMVTAWSSAAAVVALTGLWTRWRTRREK